MFSSSYLFNIKICKNTSASQCFIPSWTKIQLFKKKCSYLIFKQIRRPILTYACPIWGNCTSSSSHIKKMQIVQNKVLRIIYCKCPIVCQKCKSPQRLSNPKYQRSYKNISKNCPHCSLLNSSGAIRYNLLTHPTHRRLKRGRPHDLLH